MRKKKALNNIITSIILQFVTIISGLIIPRLFITSFGTNINGLISSATQFLSYITLLESGIGGVARAMLYKPLNNKNKDEIASIIKSVEGFFKKIALVFIVYLIILAFSFKYISNSPLDYYSTFALVIIIGLGSFAQYYFGISYQVLLQADQKQYITTSIQIITIIINVICTYIMIKLGFGILAVKLITSLIFVLRPILLNIYVKKKYELLINSNTKETKLVQAFDGLSHHVAYFLHSNTDIVIITLFLNVSYVSVYAIYNMISSGLRNLSIAFSSSIEATFGNMLANKEYESVSWQVKDKGNNVWILHALAVGYEYRNQGFGTILVRHILSQAQKEGIEAIHLDVIDKNTVADKLYEKLGFKYISTENIFYEVVGNREFRMYEYTFDEKEQW